MYKLTLLAKISLDREIKKKNCTEEVGDKTAIIGQAIFSKEMNLAGMGFRPSKVGN